MINKKDIVNRLENTKFAVLATADKYGNVSASQVCIVNEGLNVYIQTDRNFEKIKNIEQNKKVALNIGSMYFKGVAKILDHPTQNKKFIEKIKEKHPRTYKSYTNLPNEVLIRIKLTECKIWNVDSKENIRNQDIIGIYDLVNDKQEIIISEKM
jgi:general stress protein 26